VLVVHFLLEVTSFAFDVSLSFSHMFVTCSNACEVCGVNIKLVHNILKLKVINCAEGNWKRAMGGS
jgi:hypothetical protein